MKIIKLNKKSKSKLDTIVEGCIRKESASQELLFRELSPRVFTTCIRYESPTLGAKDILQETFIRVFKNIHQFNPKKGKLETWIKKIAINYALREISKQKIQFVELSQEIEIESEIELTEDIYTITDEQLLSLIKDLPEGYKAVFNLFVIDGYSHKEIAQILGVAISTSKSQLVKAKKMLRKKINVLKTTNQYNEFQ